MPLGKGVDSGVNNPNGYTLNYNGKVIKHFFSPDRFFLFGASKFYLFIFLSL